jgi:predicted nucleic acid-binding protein
MVGNMETIRTYFFDASALVKIYLREPGSKSATQFKNDGGRVYTSWVVIAEALGVLKRHWLRRQLSEAQYAKSVYLLFADVRLGVVHPVDVRIENGRASIATYEGGIIEVRRQHPTIDAADALQLLAIQDSWLRALGGESQTRLVTADGGMAEAAQARGIPTILVQDDHDP